MCVCGAAGVWGGRGRRGSRGWAPDFGFGGGEEESLLRTIFDKFNGEGQDGEGTLVMGKRGLFKSKRGGALVIEDKL